MGSKAICLTILDGNPINYESPEDSGTSMQCTELPMYSDPPERLGSKLTPLEYLKARQWSKVTCPAHTPR